MNSSHLDLFVRRPHKYVWHGSLSTGERAMDLYCDAWDSDSPDKVKEIALTGNL